ncbi:MAG: NosD domain-containing protein [Candidatus Hodarchaeales archaeon]
MNHKFILSSLVIQLFVFSFIITSYGIYINTTNEIEPTIPVKNLQKLCKTNEIKNAKGYTTTESKNGTFEKILHRSPVCLENTLVQTRNQFMFLEERDLWTYQTESSNLRYQIYFLNQGLSFEIEKNDQLDKKTCFEVKFLNATNCPVIAEDINTMGNYCQKLLYYRIYPNIDLLYYIVDGILKYEFHIYPNGDPSIIKMQYSGIKGMQISRMGEEVLIQTIHGYIKEHELNVYQPKGKEQVNIPTKYALSGFNTLGFEIEPYDTSRTLIIDPFISMSQETRIKISELSSHEPIVITSNNDFRTQASIENWPGNGSITFPYVISNYNFSGSINISNVNDFFVIHDNFIYSQDDGIVLSNASNCKIINNTINSKRRGIVLDDSACSGVIISDNKIKGFTGLGIVIYASNTIISGNILEGYMSESYSPIALKLVKDVGIYNNVSRNIITNCTIAIQIEQQSNLIDVNQILYCKSGIFVSNDYNNITNNDISSCDLGISNGGAKYCQFVNNTLNNIYQYGINITNSFKCDCLFIRNTISNCGQEGIRIIDSTSIHLIKNRIIDSLKYNLYVKTSNNLNISYNTLQTTTGTDIFFNDSLPCYTNFFYRNHYSSSYGIPILNLEEVLNNTDVQENENISFSFQYVDDALYYSWDGQAEQYIDSPYIIPKVSSEGNHTLESWVYDAYGNCLRNFYIFYLNNNPIIEVNPNNMTFSFNHRLTWLVSDVEGTYLVYKNETLSATGFWSTAAPIYFKLDGLPIGTYNFTIVVLDTHGGNIKHESVVEIDEYATRTPFNINDLTLKDLALVEGWYGDGSQSNPYTISWYNITGNQDERLIIINSNSSFLIEKNILAHGEIAISATFLHDCIIKNNTIFNSTWGIKLQDSVNITLSNNEIKECQEAGIAFISSSFSTAVNNTLVKNHIGITVDGNISQEITYSTNISIYSNHFKNNIFYGLSIIRAVNSNIILNFFDGNYGYGVSLGKLANNSLLYHNCFLNNGDKNSQAIDNGTTNTWFDISLQEGNLWYDLTGSSYYTIDGISGSIDLWPLNILSITSPTGFSMPLGEPDQLLIWTQTKTNVWNRPIFYELYDNGSKIEIDEWSGNTVVFMLENLKPHGIHNLTLVVIYQNSFNYRDRYTTISVWMNILPDTIPPDISSPQDIVMVEGTFNNSITWICHDYNPTYATITRNDTLISNKSWSEGNISIDLEDLTIGTYNFTLILFDIGSNMIADSVMVHVIELPPDDKNPEVDYPVNLEIYENTPGSIVWVVYDEWPANYTIYRNQSFIVQQGYWSSGIIRYSFDSLPIGTWNFTIILCDLTGNLNSSSVLVIVKSGSKSDSIPPSISHPRNKTISTDQQGEYIEFNIFDEHPDQIFVTIDGKLVYQSDWTSPNQKVRIYLDGLSIGKHDLTVTAIDIFNNTAVRSITITVIGDNSPPNVSEPVIAEGAITWYVTDANPATYSLILLTNNTVIRSGSYTNGTITFVIGYFPHGTYTIRLIVYDKFGHFTISDATFKDTDSKFKKTSGFELVTILPLLIVVVTVKRKKSCTKQMINP